MKTPPMPVDTTSLDPVAPSGFGREPQASDLVAVLEAHIDKMKQRHDLALKLWETDLRRRCAGLRLSITALGRSLNFSDGRSAFQLFKSRSGCARVEEHLRSLESHWQQDGHPAPGTVVVGVGGDFGYVRRWYPGGLVPEALDLSTLQDDGAWYQRISGQPALTVIVTRALEAGETEILSAAFIDDVPSYDDLAS